ncbi:hypothetical protein MZUP3_730 [Erwinia phage vB_EhrS_49]|uniref:Uncharacterized protein n=2 Tax=Feofaniavirus TaxID=2733174 RepID=A0A4Y1NRI9_9CAUD|nr:hypothetical protein HOV54_gp73 [Erwinia phage vB_EhrS_49]YP_009824104.1 hypothetical protein HOV55_gp74 [Erwinia phage vB_EhrS_59]AXH43475.1 hypothetical protein MZUP3_730 [Erwinia phage vB_EhrS_49]AXH43592.1 hypothetical protein MZUP2_740 [Erwinia phage vB_EhrS_59]
MATKNKGICGHCRETVSPIVIEENTFSRDKCQCPECAKDLYVCRSPGCDDYAKGGKDYDEELCPGCTKSLAENAGVIAKTIGGVALTIGTAMATNHFTGKKD